MENHGCEKYEIKRDSFRLWVKGRIPVRAWDREQCSGIFSSQTAFVNHFFVSLSKKKAVCECLRFLQAHKIHRCVEKICGSRNILKMKYFHKSFQQEGYTKVCCENVRTIKGWKLCVRLNSKSDTCLLKYNCMCFWS